ncbi:ferrochelatase, partial [Nocardioides sp.]|uniref:ferrochelatase n=1 Tax=Nocardioides sp. TaxID=35761 RepID=UPI002C08B9A9
MDVSPYDALLFLSFGGPEKPEDVVPFLENVTRGRGIPRERLEEVGQHYYRFGGRSPINDQNRAFLAALRADLAANGVDIGVYWGNRNWDPYLADTLRRMQADGVRRAAVFTTSAYASYSSCRQYRENLHDASAAVHSEIRLDKLRHYFNHPGFA